MTCDKCGAQPEHFYRLFEPAYWSDPDFRAAAERRPSNTPYRFCSLTCLIEWAAESGRETPFAVIEKLGDP